MPNSFPVPSQQTTIFFGIGSSIRCSEGRSLAPKYVFYNVGETETPSRNRSSLNYCGAAFEKTSGKTAAFAIPRGSLLDLTERHRLFVTEVTFARALVVRFVTMPGTS